MKIQNDVTVKCGDDGVIEDVTSKSNTKNETKGQKISAAPKFATCAHAIFAPVCAVLGGEIKLFSTPPFKEVKNDADAAASAVLVGDTAAVAAAKVRKAFCPGGAESSVFNPVLAQFELVAALQDGPLHVAGTEFALQGLREAYASGTVTPQQLKDALAQFYAPLACIDAVEATECATVYKMK